MRNSPATNGARLCWVVVLGAWGALASSAGRLYAQESLARPTLGVLTPGMMGQADVAAPSDGAGKEEGFWSNLKVTGYIQSSYNYNFNRPQASGDGTENRFRTFDTRANEFMLNQAEVKLEKPVDENHLAGFVFNPLIGQSAQVTQAEGLFRRDGASLTDLDVVQANVQLFVPFTGGTLTVGKFITSAGSEVIWAPENDNISRSFLFGLAIPFTHTGLLYSQPLAVNNDAGESILSASVGLVNGWDNVRDSNDSKCILTNLTLVPNDVFSLYTNFFFSFSEQTNESNSRTLLDIVSTIRVPDTGLKLTGNFDVGAEEGAASDGTYAVWWGFALGARFDFAVTDENVKDWFVAGRFEYFNDGDGARTGTDGNFTLHEFTATVGHQVCKNVVVRAEFRHDQGSQRQFFKKGGADTNTPSENGQSTVGLDAILSF